ncbi:hypothetical protein Mpt1_c00330 [Candidatus Methanoplasma termitum]|uniref:DUF2116 family Zn-ribbon domain-containing protein n=1 Tax=Candidatus Methanoplasma termitum TaxID=1577791 RepID=A0A0A7LEI6_9ARCH|nr:DUF2116 family Zn-ribbon domain-containing protein [Candidatus Methanoplasma termitum]AIZ55941.1 hypothetical protein Mpt1_c00330 [Candidatus Methanoplasma termitum]MCL2334259.1 DUF2116 family Zn-ribbon domain-containing protein [Candidatus Methanoplasma sp.]
MSIRLPEHDHCKFCGDPVPFDRAFCSEDCYWKEQARIKKDKNSNIRFAVITAVSVAIIIVAGFFLRNG